MNPARPLPVGDPDGPLLDAFRARWLPEVEAGLARSLPLPAGLPPALAVAVEEALGTTGHPGSRWRPLLTLAAAKAAGGNPGTALPAALAVELTHTASLVLDDLPAMDDADVRRGRSATHLRVGSGGAILLAVSLLARSAELLGGTPGTGGRLAAEWGEAFGLAGMSGGQAVDLTGSFASGGSPRRLHRRKTTGLSALALRAGALVVAAPHPVVEGLTRFGRDLGWAYQLADDAQDWREDARLGRGPGGRSPLRQARRVLEGAIRRLGELEPLSGEGALLLEALARRTVGVPASPGGAPWA